MRTFLKALMAYAPAAFMAVSVHGALAAGFFVLAPREDTPPQILSSFEVVELPSSAAVIQEPEPDPEPAPEPEPTPEPEPAPKPESKPKPKPKPTPPKPPVKPKPPKPEPVSKPLEQPKPKSPPVPRKALVQQDASEAPATAYVAPSQHAHYLDNPKPAYPSMARKRGMEGRVVLRVSVQASGRVGGVRIAQSSGYALLDRAARTAVQRWRFAPATRGGIPVDGEVLVPFDFRLTNS